MTKEKELLLIDLSARLPYEPLIYVDEKLPRLKIGASTRIWEYVGVSNPCKPYLRPMSSMTEEEKLYLKLNYGFELHGNVLSNLHIIKGGGFYEREGEYVEPTEDRQYTHITIDTVLELIKWLNAHHFDYRGLIEKGLAIEAPENMYKNK